MVHPKDQPGTNHAAPADLAVNGKSHINGAAPEKNEGCDPLICDAVTTILERLDPEPARDGLLKTPARVAKSLQFLTSGYTQDIDAVINEALFETNNEKTNEMNGFISSDDSHDMFVAPIIVRDIDLFSLCEHHMLPFCGKATVAYKPVRGKVIGLSKIARIIDIFSRRLQLQERLTQQVSECVAKATSARGVAVIIEASHMCMISRGVQKANARTKTMSFIGDYLTNAEERREVLLQMT